MSNENPIQLTSTEMVPATSTGLALPLPANVEPKLWETALKVLPPDAVARWAAKPRPAMSEVQALMAALSPERQAKLEELLAKANPQKEGMDGGADIFKPLVLKVYHGTGNDAMRPDKLPPGSLYGSDGVAVDEPFRGILVYLNAKARNLWADRNDPNAPKHPLCSSVDGEHGSKNGDCKKCPFAVKKYNEGGCQPEIHAWFIAEDLSAIYQMSFAKSGLNAGNMLKKFATTTRAIWDTVYELSLEKKTNDKNTQAWYVPKVSKSARKNPAENVSDKALHPLFQLFSRLVYNDAIMRSTVWTYSKTAHADSAEAVLAGETVDAEALLKETNKTAGAQDFESEG